MLMSFPLSSPGVTRYAQLSSLFRRRIEAGEWPVGERIPTLEALVAQFGVARATIRQALDALEADGLVARYRAKGTFVLKRSQPVHAIQLAVGWAALSQAHEGASIDVIDDRNGARPPVLLEPGQRYAVAYRYMKRVHRRDGVPYLLGDVYLDMRISRSVSRARLRATPMLRIVKEQSAVPIANAHEVLTVAAADLESASALAIPINAPVAIVDRNAYDKSATLVYYSRGVYRGDHVRLDITLK